MSATANSPSTLDCIIIGGGPAGLAAAVYLTRFRRDVLLLDGQSSRASLIPVSHNCPGFPHGIRGPDLLDRMRDQARRYQTPIRPAKVTSLRRDGDGFVAELDDPGAARRVGARTVLMATGVVDIHPPVPDLADAIQRGLVRYCPICDGFEAIDRRIAVLGSGEKGAKEALFVSSYSSDVTLLSLEPRAGLTREGLRRLSEAGVRVVEEPVGAMRVQGDGITVCGADGRDDRFDTLYSALGSTVQSDLARALGAKADDMGALVVDAHGRTTVPGLWAAGDVVSSLDQIAVAFGEAATAATDIHNALRDRELRPGRVAT